MFDNPVVRVKNEPSVQFLHWELAQLKQFGSEIGSQTTQIIFWFKKKNNPF